MQTSMNIFQWVMNWSRLQPEKTAVCFEGRKISYLQLHTAAGKVAAFFRHYGIASGQRIAVLMDNCPELIEIYLACANRGLILVPLNTRWAAEEVRWAVNNCDPALVIYHDRFKERILECLAGSALDAILKIEVPKDQTDYLQQLAARTVGPQVEDIPAVNPLSVESPHVIMYTSGTTGRPKGAILSIRKTFFNCLNAQFFFDLQSHDRMLLSLPLFHSGGLFIQVSPVLYRGASLVIQSRFDADATYQDIEQYRITKYLTVPTIMKKLLAVPEEKRADLSSLKICAVGGEKLENDLVKQCLDAGFPLYQLMGQTETSIILWATDQELTVYPTTAGKPVFHGQVEVFNETGRSTKPGEIGELAISGPTLMSGYWRLDEPGAEKIREGWRYTGDMAVRNASGYFFIVDRATDVYISGGENVYPAEVERVLKTHDGIVDVAVIGVPDPRWGESGHAFIIKAPEAALCEKDILSFCESRLAKFKWPSKITFCKAFPRTVMGKIIKNQVQAKA